MREPHRLEVIQMLPQLLAQLFEPLDLALGIGLMDR
jgi:hypothetical protein